MLNEGSTCTEGGAGGGEEEREGAGRRSVLVCVFEPRRQVDLPRDSLEGEEGADEEDDVRRGIHLEGSEGGGAG